MELLKTIDQLNKTIKNMNNNNKTNINKISKNIIPQHKTEKSNALNFPSIDISQFEKEKNAIQFEFDQRNEEIKKILQDKQNIEEQNIFISKDNQQLRQKINELKLQISFLQQNSSSSLYSMKDASEDYDFKKDLNKSNKSRDKSSESRRVSQVRSTFGITLKKVSAGKGAVDYILKAQEENIKRQKEAKILFPNIKLKKVML